MLTVAPGQPWRQSPALHGLLGPLGQKIYTYIQVDTVDRTMHMGLGVKESCSDEKEAFMKIVGKIIWVTPA